MRSYKKGPTQGQGKRRGAAGNVMTGSVTHTMGVRQWCPKRGSNPHPFRDRILNPARLPFHHSGGNGALSGIRTRTLLPRPGPQPGVSAVPPSGRCLSFSKRSLAWCPRRDLNPHPLRDRLLRPARLPFHHMGFETKAFDVVPREGLEPSTPAGPASEAGAFTFSPPGRSNHKKSASRRLDRFATLTAYRRAGGCGLGPRRVEVSSNRDRMRAVMG